MESLFSKKKSNSIRQIYLITLIFTCFTFFQQTLPISAVDHFQLNFGIKVSDFIYATSLFFISYALMQLPGGIILDRYGVKYVLPLSISITTLGVIVFWFSTNEWMIGLGRIVTGFGSSIAYISGIYVASCFSEKSKLALLICFLESSANIGGLIAAMPLQIAINNLGWLNVGLMNIALCLALLIWSILASKDFAKTLPSNSVSMKKIFDEIFYIFKNKRMLFIFGYSFCTWFVIMSFPGYWFKDYLQIMHQYSVMDSLNLVEIYWGFFLVACLMVGIFARSLQSSKIILLFLASTGFLTYLIMAQPYLFSNTGLILFSLFGGISASGIIIAFSLIPWLIPFNFQGAAVALNNTFIIVGGYIGQILFGFFVKNVNINHFFHIISDNKIEPYHYTALLIYLIFTFFALIFAFFIWKSKDINL